MKKYIFLYLTICLVLVSCGETKMSPTGIVEAYYEGFENGNFGQIRKVIGDSISIKSGDYVSSYSRNSFYNFFKWDSVLQTRKKLVELDTSGSEVITTISYSSARYQFLNNNNLTCSYKIIFKDEKISLLEELDCPNANWPAWEKQVNELVEWIKIHHPELDGFINDLTMQGGINYMKALQLYKNRENP